MTETEADYVCYVAITASQAALASAACQETIKLAEDAPEELSAGVGMALVQLRDFFKDVAENPAKYANGELLKTLKRIRKAQKHGARS